MSINKPCFERLYNDCCKIINSSTDKNILSKKSKLDSTYNELCQTEDCELQKFYSIVFELKTYDYIKSKNIYIKARNDNKIGPDFECDFGYLECISITKGAIGTESRKYVDKMLAGSVNRHKSEIHRISSAIKDKKDKYLKYLSQKVIDIAKPIIIVVNTSIFANEFQSSSCIEDTMQILYAIGNEYLLYDTKNKCFVDTPNRQNRNYDNIGKKSDTTNLEFDYFYKEEYKDISAVILVCNYIFEEINNSNFKIFINPNANCGIDRTKIAQFDYFSLVKENENGFAVYEWNNKNPPA